MAYMRMHESRFWGWVITSLLVGLAIGTVGMYFIGRTSANKKIEANRTELATQLSAANSKAADLEAKLASSESSVTSLTEANTQLTAQVDKAKEDAKVSSDSSSALSVVSREIQPDNVSGSDTITMIAKVKGSPDKVTMRIKAKSGTYDETYTLEKASTSGSTETWRATAEAPSKAGDYTYYATAISGDTKVTMPGTSPSTLTVN